MADFDKLEKGTQVVYVPPHADGRLDHPNSEEGFVTSKKDYGGGDQLVWCRFWSKYDPRQLRTRSCSEACFPAHLVVKDTRPQSEVDAKLAEIEGALAPQSGKEWMRSD